MSNATRLKGRSTRIALLAMYESIFACFVHCISKKACFIQTQLHPESIRVPLTSTPIPRLTIDQPQSLENSPLGFPPVPTPRLRISPSLQVYPATRTSLAYPTTIKLPALHMLRVASQIPLERRPRRPPCDSAPYSTPRTDDDIDPAVHIGVFGLGVGFQIGGFGGPIGILPHDESFVQGVEAVTAERGRVDWKRFLVAFGVCKVQGQGVGDPPFLLQRPDYFVDEVVGHGFVWMGQD